MAGAEMGQVYGWDGVRFWGNKTGIWWEKLCKSLVIQMLHRRGLKCCRTVVTSRIIVSRIETKRHSHTCDTLWIDFEAALFFVSHAHLQHVLTQYIAPQSLMGGRRYAVRQKHII